MKLSQVATAANISRAAARRFLKTLEVLGYVGLLDDRYYLRAKVLELGFAYLSSMDFQELANPYLSEVARQCEGSSCVGVMDGGEIVFVARAMTEQRIRLVGSIGLRHPAYAVSLGRAILANLPDEEISNYMAKVKFDPLTDFTITNSEQLRSVLESERRRGWYGCKDETKVGVTAIAVPIFDAKGKVKAAVNLNVSPRIVDPVHVAEKYLPILNETAKQLSKALDMDLVPVSV
ncbi:MAG: transcriptional regulator, IclR family [Hyphomicrobiales bacterium]|nr:transcriptional regulator, IclR family [Hyphomicrobiales bacterium]